MKNNFIKVKSDVSLVRDITSDAIVNRNKSEFDKFNNFFRISVIWTHCAPHTIGTEYHCWENESLDFLTLCSYDLFGEKW